MNIVFIVGSYYPYYSAVGKCVGNIADELSKEHKITVICQKNLNEQDNNETHNTQKVIRINTNENRIRNNINKKIKNEKGIKRKCYQLFSNAYKLSRVINTICSSVTIKKELVNEYLKALNGIKEPIDLIIPASMPFESVVAGLKYIEEKGRKVKMIPYLFDQFTENRTLHRLSWNVKIKRKRHLKIEEYMLEESISVFMMNQLYQHFTSEFSNYKGKINTVEHPLLKGYSNKTINRDTEGLSIIYTGSFYKNIRNPEYFLEVVDKALIKLKARMDIYSFGNCDEIIQRYSDKNHLIVTYGKVTTEKAYEAIGNSNILIAVGNIDDSQVPSKIFEYMSFGKPIIYFYTVNDDINLKILKRYPLSLCLKQDTDKLDENIESFNVFCEEHAKSNISFEEVEKIFYYATPKYTVDLILRLMEQEGE